MANTIDSNEMLSDKFSEEKLKKIKFEEGLKAVEELVARVESGALSLDHALQAYERGSMLIDHLRSLLEGAEAKLQLLNEKRKPTS